MTPHFPTLGRILAAAAVAAQLHLAAGFATAADWPQYNGPLGDNSTPETIRTNWAELPPRVLWRRPIGPAWSSIAVSQGRLYTQVRRSTPAGDREFCVALDAETGAELWSSDLDVADYTDVQQADIRADGPRSTPAVDGDRVYLYTSRLRLTCLRTSDGTPVWTRDFIQELGSPNIPWEGSASPLIVGDLVFVNSNGGSRRLTAIRKSDGTTAWSAHNDGLTHATPIHATIHDVPQVIFLTRAGLVAVTPDSGALLWRLAFSPSSTSTAASPSVAGEYVYASAAYGSGTWVARVTKSGGTFNATLVARQQGTAYQAHWATPVARDGFFYTVPAPNTGQGRLACLEAATVRNRWAQTVVGSSDISYGSVIQAANTLVVLTEGGELVLVEPNPDRYVETARLQLLNLYCWNRPVIAHGRLYARNSAANPEIVAVDLAPPQAPLPPLTLSASIPAAGTLRIEVRAVTGVPLTSEHAARLELVSTDHLPAAESEWRPLNLPLASAGAQLQAEGPLLPEPARFIRVRVKP